ncbi:tyrosine-type recombinase/integrase [Methylophaga sp.]|uniref:tyrosine-type recombinase/integrase n=1 Tax=Methylophaga sp. TaxID=2024840 RepID=UPI003F72CA3E
MINHQKKIRDIPIREREFYPTRDGLQFDIYSSRWQLSINSSLDVGWLSSHLPSHQEEAIRRTLASRAEILTHNTINTSMGSFKKFCLSFVDNSDEGVNIDSILSLFASDVSKSIKSDTKVLLIETLKNGYEDAFEAGIESFLKQIIIGDRGSRFNAEKSESTRALTEYERKQFMYQLIRARYAGLLRPKEYLALILLFITGKRPIQLANTKICDFKTELIQIGTSTREITVYRCPVAKQKSYSFRTEFNEIPLSPELGIESDIENVALESISNAKRILGDITPEQQQLVPLFCISHMTAIRQEKIKTIGVNKALNENFLHTERGISLLINHILRRREVFAILSERTGKVLNIYPRRLRHTHATRLALSGASIAEVANSLDHASYKAAMVYVNSLPALAIKIGEQLETTLSALAKRFDKNQEIKVNPEKVIKLYTKHGSHDVGMCGKETFCTDDYPIACYECELFVPNPFGNHKAVLDYVEKKLAESKDFGDLRGLENWRTILIAVLERKFMADQVKLQMLNEIPTMNKLTHDGVGKEK